MGAIVALWVPMVAFAHVFSIYWLLHALALIHPGFLQRFTACFRRGPKAGVASRSSPAKKDSTGVELAFGLDGALPAAPDAAAGQVRIVASLQAEDCVCAFPRKLDLSFTLTMCED